MFLRGGDPYIRYTLVSERNLSIVIYLDPEESLFKPLFEIGSIEVLTDYMYGKSSLDTTNKIKTAASNRLKITKMAPFLS